MRESTTGKFINMMLQSENKMISYIFDLILNVKTTAQVSCKYSFTRVIEESKPNFVPLGRSMKIGDLLLYRNDFELLFSYVILNIKASE